MILFKNVAKVFNNHAMRGSNMLASQTNPMLAKKQKKIFSIKRSSIFSPLNILSHTFVKNFTFQGGCL